MESSEKRVPESSGHGTVHKRPPARHRRRSPLLTALKIIGLLVWAGLWIATIGWVVGW